MKGVCMYSKDVQSKFFTADAKISTKPCWLHYAQIVPAGAVTDTSMYDGHNTNGELIFTLNSAVATIQPFRPAKPVYCKKGLYLDIGSNTTGVFIQWEEEAVQAPAPGPTE
jgi:hypothetical protein